MIDLENETVLSLTEAAKQLPRRRAGKRPHVATLYRWANRGLRGIQLETIQVGGTLCTSAEALQRFFERLSSDRRKPDSDPNTNRRQEVSDAITRLRERGV